MIMTTEIVFCYDIVIQIHFQNNNNVLLGCLDAFECLPLQIIIPNEVLYNATPIIKFNKEILFRNKCFKTSIYIDLINKGKLSYLDRM